MRAIRRPDKGPRPGPPAARAIAAYMFRLHRRVDGARSLEEIETMTADELRAFAAANGKRAGARSLVRAIDNL